MIKDILINCLRRGIPYGIRQMVVSSLLKLDYGGGQYFNKWRIESYEICPR